MFLSPQADATYSVNHFNLYPSWITFSHAGLLIVSDGQNGFCMLMGLTDHWVPVCFPTTIPIVYAN